jgi:hypothetical protein
MVDGRGRGHVEVASDDLVAPAVVREETVVLIRPVPLGGPSVGVFAFRKNQRLGHGYLLAPGDEIRIRRGES